MNRNFTLAVLVGAVVLVALAIWQRDTVPVNVAEGTPTATPGPLLSLSAADVQEVEVAGPAGKKVTLKRAGAGWEVDGQPADDTVEGTITRTVAVAALQTLPADTRPEDYGFETPALTVTLKTTGTQATVLLVGDDVLGESGSSYLKVSGEGQPIVIVTNTELKTLLGWLDSPPLAPTPTPEGGAPITDTMGITSTLGLTDTLNLATPPGEPFTDTLQAVPTALLLPTPVPVGTPTPASP